MHLKVGIPLIMQILKNCKSILSGGGLRGSPVPGAKI